MRSLRDVLVNDFGLDLTDWRLISAAGVSANGLTIVGHGYHADGNYEAWIATIPEPGTTSLLVVLGLAFLALRRRRRP